MERRLLTQMDTFAQDVLSRLGALGAEPREKAILITLSGELGAGKTTFVQVLGRALDIKDVIQSPTYVLMKSYPISFGALNTLVHIDAYRLGSAQELTALKSETFLNNPQALVVIEWPERVEGALPKPDLEIRFASADESGVPADPQERYIEVI